MKAAEFLPTPVINETVTYSFTVPQRCCVGFNSHHKHRTKEDRPARVTQKVDASKTFQAPKIQTKRRWLVWKAQFSAEEIRRLVRLTDFQTILDKSTCAPAHSTNSAESVMAGDNRQQALGIGGSQRVRGTSWRTLRDPLPPSAQRRGSVGRAAVCCQASFLKALCEVRGSGLAPPP